MISFKTISLYLTDIINIYLLKKKRAEEYKDEYKKDKIIEYNTIYDYCIMFNDFIKERENIEQLYKEEISFLRKDNDFWFDYVLNLSSKKKQLYMEELTKIQNELKVNKLNYNSFGKYYYRTAEDIQEAVKPLLLKHECSLNISYDIVAMGTRIYVKAKATFSSKTKTIEVFAFAREEDSKKGMDGSQVTGASSSYAAKYCLQALFLLDDNKDSDTTNKEDDKKPTKEDNKKPNFQPIKEQMTTEAYAKAKEYLIKAENKEEALAKIKQKYVLPEEILRDFLKIIHP